MKLTLAIVNLVLLSAPASALTAEAIQAILAAADKDPNALIVENAPNLSSTSSSTREQALRNILHHLQTAYNKQRYPTEENKRKLSTELIRLYHNKEYSPTGLGRRDLIQGITRYGENEVAKPFILKLLDEGPQVERDAALAVLGAPGGISGPEIFDKVADLAKRGDINSQGRTTMLARVDKKKALPEILKDLETTKDKEQFVYSAWALQDYYRNPDNYRFIVPRLKEFGLTSDGRIMNKSFKGGSGIGWIDADLFSQYIENAPKNDSKEAFGIMVLDSLLCKPSTVPMLMRMLKHGDPNMRLLAAQGLRKASGYSRADNSIFATLKAALASETDEVTKKGIKTEIDTIDRHEMMRKRSEERRRP